MMTSTFPKPVDRPISVAELVAQHPNPPISISGDESAVISSIGNPDNGETGSIVFVEGEGAVAEARIGRTHASVIVRKEGDRAPASRCYIQSDDPRAWFIGALSVLYRPTAATGADPSARIDPTAKVAADCRIGPFAVIEAGVEIGAGASIGAHTVILAESRIGARASIQHHVTIGSDGIAFHRNPAGQWHFFPHQGRVLIGEDVVIGSQSVVARGMLQDTIIGAGSKLGSFVNVGHNCSIGENCWLSTKVVLAGGARLEDEVRLAASVSVSDRIVIGRGARIGLGSVVTKNVPEGAAWFGNPARPLRTMRAF